MQLQPAINAHHTTLLPAIFACLDAETAGRRGEKVQEMASMALEHFCETLEAEILPYLEPLMQKLIGLLCRPDSRRTVQVSGAPAQLTTAPLN